MIQMTMTVYRLMLRKSLSDRTDDKREQHCSRSLDRSVMNQSDTLASTQDAYLGKVLNSQLLCSKSINILYLLLV